MTVEEFREFAEADSWKRYELHAGQIVEMTQPKYDHHEIFSNVGIISEERHLAAKRMTELFGAPDFVAEVLSPSNRYGEMQERQEFCLAHGYQSF